MINHFEYFIFNLQSSKLINYWAYMLKLPFYSILLYDLEKVSNFNCWNRVNFLPQSNIYK
jgi:hypothetical protein